MNNNITDEAIKSNYRNNSIDIFRLICAVLIVAIHTSPLTDINKYAGFFSTGIFPRIAVPFFFCVAGYFYIGSLLSGKKVLMKYVSKLLVVYVIWSFIYFLCEFLIVLNKGTSIIEFVKKCILLFFIIGSSYHLWFFPALFFAVIVITLIHKLKLLNIFAWFTIVLYILGCLGCSYYKIGNDIPIVSAIVNSSQFTLIRRVVLMGLPFFTLGYFLNIWKNKYNHLLNRKLILYFILISILFLLEIFLVFKLRLQKDIVITLFLYPLLAVVMMLLLNNPLSQKTILSHRSRIVANFTYYSHPLFIMLINIVFINIINIKISSTLLFILTLVFTIIGGAIIAKLNNKWLNKLVI